MGYIYRFKKYLWLVVLSVASLPLLANCVDAEKVAKLPDHGKGGSPVPEGATCYLVGPEIKRLPTLEETKASLKNLEERYKRGEINQKTYETKKKHLQETIKRMEEVDLIEKSIDERTQDKVYQLKDQLAAGKIDKKTFNRKKDLIMTEKVYFEKYQTVVYKHPKLHKLREKIKNDPKHKEMYENQLMKELNLLIDLNTSN